MKSYSLLALSTSFTLSSGSPAAERYSFTSSGEGVSNTVIQLY